MILGVLVWAILGTIAAGYYFVQYDSYRKEYSNLVDQLRISLEVNILLNYGNGTKVWHNNTVLPLGSTSFTAIYHLADTINYTDNEEFGILVTSINGVANNSTHGWLYWQWDPQDSMWMLPEYSSGKHILHNGEVIAFALVDYMEGWPPPPPT